MTTCRRYGAWLGALAVASGCTGFTQGADQASPAMPESSIQSTGSNPAYEVFAEFRDPPSLAVFERLLGGQAVAIPRQDRHSESVFPGGVRLLRIAPAPSDGRARLDRGEIAALVVARPSPPTNCQSAERLSERLVASGWTAAPRFLAERHGQGGPGRQTQNRFSRHDHHLRLELFSASNGCLSGYALLWNMDLSLLYRLMPEGLRANLSGAIDEP